MKFIEHSNSVYKSNNKYKSPKRKKIKKIIIEVFIFVFVMLVLFGVLNESAQNSNSLNSLRSSHRLGSYENHKLAYGVSGTGSTIVLFEPDIGKTLLQWNPIILNPIIGTRMIYYDRFGYGGSDFFKGDTSVELQSDILNNLVINAGYTGKSILVSEGYGSLIHIEYLKKYRDKVGGMILINPSLFKCNDESYLNDIVSSFSNGVMRLFSNLSIPRILDKFSILNNQHIDLYREKSVSKNKDNYLSRMVSSDYYTTIAKERSSMKMYLNKFDFNRLGVYNLPIIVVESKENRSDEYEMNLKKYFENVEVIYVDNIEDFTYSSSNYLIELISNINSRIQ